MKYDFYLFDGRINEVLTGGNDEGAMKDYLLEYGMDGVDVPEGLEAYIDYDRILDDCLLDGFEIVDVKALGDFEGNEHIKEAILAGEE